MIILTAILSHLLCPAFPAPATEPPEVLTVPIKGNIGADATVEGLSAALQLVETRPIDTVVLEIDALTGDFETGVELAELIASIPDSIRVVGILQRVGGPSLPVARSCDEWLVQSSISIRVPDPRGGMTDRTLGADRVVIQTLPSLTRSATRLKGRLERIRRACLEITGESVDVGSDRAPGRASLIEALTAAPDGLDGTDLDVAGRGPGIRGDRLVSLGLAEMWSGDEARFLVRTGGVNAIPLGDTGSLVMEASADEAIAARGRLGSRIDSLFSSLDGVATLSAGAPWSIARARLSDPESPRLSDRFPMRRTSGGWTIDETMVPAWDAACGDSIRRWTGVVELLETIDVLLDRADAILEEIRGMEPRPLDTARRDLAISTAAPLVSRYRGIQSTFEPVSKEARREIVRVTTLRERPPFVEDPE